MTPSLTLDNDSKNLDEPLDTSGPPPPVPTPRPAAQARRRKPARPLSGVARPVPHTADDGLAAALLKAPVEGHEGRFDVGVPEEAAATGFQFPFPARLTEGMAGEPPIRAALPNGTPLPSWLRFNPATRSFAAAAVPPGALPLEVVVTIGTRRARIGIVPGEAPP